MAFVVAGVSLAAVLGPAAASASVSDDTGPMVPGTSATCLLPLPVLCEEPPEDDWSGEQRPEEPAPQDSWSSAPKPDDSWSSAPQPTDSWPAETPPPWRPAGEREHKVPKGHPETGGGALAEEQPVWPFAVGGAALLTGAGLAGFAVRRRKDPA